MRQCWPNIAVSRRFGRFWTGTSWFDMTGHKPCRVTHARLLWTFTHPEVAQRDLDDREAIVLHIGRMIDIVPSHMLSRKHIMCLGILDSVEQLQRGI